MNTIQKNLSKFFVATFISVAILSCDSDETITDNPPIDNNAAYYLALLVGDQNSKTDVIIPADNLETGIIDPVKNGYEELEYSFYYNVGNDILVADYYKQKSIYKYAKTNEGLVKQGKVVTPLQILAQTTVDDKTSVFIGSDFQGYGDQEVYVVDTESMQITKSIKITLDTNETTETKSLPSGVIVRGDKMYISYINHNALNFGLINLTEANKAKIAVLNYPQLTLDQIITDERCPNLGRFQGQVAFQKDEKGDIYTYATSSVYSGFLSDEEPYFLSKKSGILRINKGETTFDANYHIDFEEIQPGHKINEMYYVANGKALLRIVEEDQSTFNMYTIQAAAWAAYGVKLSNTLLKTGILDLNTKEFTLLSEIPVSAGNYPSPRLVEGTKIYFQVSSESYSNVYSVDVATNQVTKGADVKGGVVTAILK